MPREEYYSWCICAEDGTGQTGLHRWATRTPSMWDVAREIVESTSVRNDHVGMILVLVGSHNVHLFRLKAGALVAEPLEG